MSKMKYGDMQEFVKKLKDMGYTEVKLVDTTNGMFMSKWESAWMGLSGSTILMEYRFVDATITFGDIFKKKHKNRKEAGL